MNESNNKENINSNNIKIEYVNPLNPNEILRTKENVEEYDNTSIETNEIQNIEFNEDVEKNSIEQQNIVQDNNTDTNIPGEEREISLSINKAKGINKLIIIIVVLIVLSIILVSILLIPKFLKSNGKTNEPIVNNPIEEQSKITLSNIITNSTNNSYYKNLTKYYTVNITSENNSIIFDLNNNSVDNPIIKQIIFNLEGRNLTISFNKLEDNTDKLNAFYAIADSIGQYQNHEIDEVGNYLYTIQNNFEFNIEGISTNNIIDPVTGINNDLINISIDIDKNINTSDLSNMIYTKDELELYKNDILYSTIELKKGDIILQTNSSTNYTILIGERKNLTNKTYDTIANIIEILYPEEINDFKSKFPILSTISFDKYKITLDPVLDSNTYSSYQNDYKFVLVEITK